MISKSEWIYVSPSSWFTFKYPKTWIVSEEDECTGVYKESDGVGALQISAYDTNSPQSATDNLSKYLANADIAADIETTIYDGHEMAQSAYQNDGTHTLIVFITKGHYLLFITYHVDLIDAEIEKESIDRIIASVQIVG